MWKPAICGILQPTTGFNFHPLHKLRPFTSTQISSCYLGLKLGFYIETLRKLAMGHILFSPAIADRRLKQHLIRTILALCGRMQVDQELDQRNAPKTQAFVEKIAASIIHVITKTVYSNLVRAFLGVF